MMETLTLNNFTLYSPALKQQKHLALTNSHATISYFKNAMKIFHSENLEAVVQRCSVKKAFLEISQNSQENTCAKVSFLINLQALGLQRY